jgi:hypothetical protein
VWWDVKFSEPIIILQQLFFEPDVSGSSASRLVSS